MFMLTKAAVTIFNQKYGKTVIYYFKYLFFILMYPKVYFISMMAS